MPWRETTADLDRAFAEQPLVVPGPQGALYGIFTPPAPDVPPADVCVILLARPRFEYHRIAVEVARRLATVGFSCFRFDYHGWGDSEGETVPLELDEPFTGDLAAVIRHLRQAMGQRRVAVWGRCFDGLTALSAFAEEADAIAGLVFIAAPVSSGLSFDEVFNWRNALRLAASPQQWRDLLFSRLSRRRAIRGFRRVVRRSLGLSVVDHASSISPLFEQNFRRMVRSQARALFLYGAEDGEYQSFQLAQRYLFAKLPVQTQRRFETVVVPGRIHWITDVNAHLEVVDRTVSWIRTLHPAYSHAAEPAVEPKKIAEPAVLNSRI